jgi:hypothetical protein
MLVGLCRRRIRRDHLLLIGHAPVPALIVLMTAVSCSAPAADMPEPRHRVIERELQPSSRWTNEGGQRLVQRGLMGNRYFDGSSRERQHFPGQQRCGCLIRPVRLCHSVFCKSRTRHDGSTLRTKNCYSRNFWNGRGVKETCLNMP